MNMDGVSVILTTYNGVTRGFLEEAIQSVLAQTYDKYELLIIDDGSTDDTKNLCAKYTDNPKVSYFYQENKGPSGARNNGIKRSKYPYICFLDDDDLYMPEKLERQVTFFQKLGNPKVGMIFSWTKKINMHGECVGELTASANGNIYRRLFFEGCFVNSPGSAMIKKDALDKVGVFNERFCYGEDYELWIRIAKNYDVYSIDEYLCKYRGHFDNATSKNNKKITFNLALMLLETLEKASDEIKEKRDIIYGRFYREMALRDFGAKESKEFMRNYMLAKSYGKVSFGLRFKSALVRFPFLHSIIKFLKRAKRRCFSRKKNR